MPSIQAVIVHHRGKAMLERAVDSLLRSSGVELAVVVVSNDCREELPEIVEAASEVHLVVASESLGFSAANNLGVSWARGHLGDPDYYYFVNNDTESTPGALAELAAALAADPAAAVAGPQLRIFGARDHLNSLGLNLTEDAWGWDEGIGRHLEAYGPLPERRDMIAVTGSALLIDAGVHHRIGGWTEVYDYYFEDLDLCLKVWERGYRVIQVPEAIVFHQISATMTVGSTRKEFLFWRNRLMLAVVHWPWGLLASVFWRAVVTEILSSSWQHNGLQRRALRETLGRLPRLLRQRRRSRGRKTWRRFLHPPGSVPVITLPAIAEDAPRAAEADAGVTEQLAGAVDEARALRPSAADGRRVLVVGWAPLPFQNQRMNYAPGGRAWQLARPLAGDGHAVCLVCGRIRGAYAEDAPPVEVFERDGVLCVVVDEATFDDDAALGRLAAAVDPAAVVGASPLPSRRAARIADGLPGEVPVWVDLFGDLMAEAQAKAAVDPGRDHVAVYRHLLIELLDRGDAFGAVSERQAYAVLGQLGLAGRLVAETAGEPLVHTVPCCTPPPIPVGGPPPADLDEADFVVLWSGGYNTWGDVDTLFAALEQAMAARPALRFVSTGGEIDGHDESSYGRFAAAVAKSPFRDRFVLKGRLPEQQAARYFRRADLGVVTERPLAERLLGSSGRILRWMADGLPFVCTRLSELGETVAAEDLGWTYPPGDAEALAARLIAAVDDPAALRAFAERAAGYAAEHFTAEATTRPLRRWVAAPRPAPDRVAAERRRLSIEPRAMRSRIEELESEVVQARRENDDLVGQVHGLRADLGTLHQSRMWQLWMTYLRLRRLLLWPFRR
jgi:hypothetical protein